MKLFAWIILACGALLASEVNQEVKEITTVYLLPMTGGLDQYLANALTTGGVLQVVTDPQKADAVFTDRVGETFERQMTALYPPPKEKEKEEDEEESAEKAKPVQVSDAPISSFSRGKGNVFLVSRKTRNVVWSINAQPKNSSAKEMDRLAAHIAKRIKDARSGK